jgi:hypothetical protein
MAEALEEFATPPLPVDSSLDLGVSYYSVGDRLIVTFSENPLPGMNVAISDGSIELRVTLDEDQLLGFEIPNFTHTFLPEHPEYLDFAATAGVSTEVIENIRSRITTKQRQHSAIEDLLRQFTGVKISL